MEELPYSEGTWFCVPLRKGGYTVGLAARTSAEGGVLLAYLFSLKKERVPQIKDVSALNAASAIRVLRIGDLSLINGQWPILGNEADWDRSLWGAPLYVRKDDLSRRAWVVRYSDVDMLKLVKETPHPYEDQSLGTDSVYGSGAVELLMTELLG